MNLQINWRTVTAQNINLHINISCSHIKFFMQVKYNPGHILF